MTAKNWLRGAIATTVLALPVLSGCGDNPGTGPGAGASGTGAGAAGTGGGGTGAISPGGSIGGAPGTGGTPSTPR